MNPPDEIEMEMGGKLRVGQKVRTYYTQKVGVIVGKCPHHGENWHVEVDGAPCEIRCAAECNLTPLPDPDPWLERVKLITYLELYICSKAGECKKLNCSHKVAHAHMVGCSVVGCRDVVTPQLFKPDAHCIPYVPEDEAREWFIVSGPKPVVLYDSNLTKGKADYIVQHWKGAEYRAFRWSDGLKGGE
jgi:hypothetical protein